MLQNFVKNSSGGRANIRDIEAVWDYIEKYKLKNSVSTNGSSNDKHNNEAQTSNQNDNPDEAVNTKVESVKSNKKKKEDRELTDQTEEHNSEMPPKKKKKLYNSNTTGNDEIQVDLKDDDSNHNEVRMLKFDFKNKILELIQPKGTMSLKKLEKRIMKLYFKEFETVECPEKIVKKFNKKLKKMEEVQVEGDDVKLVS